MRLFFPLIIAILTATQLHAAAGLTAHLRFNGDLADVTTTHNGASIAPPLFDAGIDGEALMVTTADAAVELQSPATLEFGRDFTVLAWVRTTHGGEQVVVYRGDPARFTSPALQFNVQGPKFFIYGDGQGSLGADFSTTHGKSVNDGEWHQIGISYSAGTTPHFTMYLDGVGKKPGDPGMFFAGDFVTKTNAANSVVRIGGRDAESGGYHFNGMIDDVQIYDRTLTAGQVKALFETPGSVVQLPLVPAIIVQPQALQTVAAGTSASFTVQAEARNALNYQWQLNGTNIAGATAATLTLPSVTLSQAGNYTVVVSNADGTITSAPGRLVVGGAPELGLKMYAGITLKGTAGLRYRIDYAEAIGAANNWVELTNVVLVSNQSFVLDLESPNSSKRVYRAVLTP
jgi:hypothetical protein